MSPVSTLPATLGLSATRRAVNATSRRPARDPRRPVLSTSRRQAALLAPTMATPAQRTCATAPASLVSTPLATPARPVGWLPVNVTSRRPARAPRRPVLATPRRQAALLAPTMAMPARRTCATAPASPVSTPLATPARPVGWLRANAMSPRLVVEPPRAVRPTARSRPAPRALTTATSARSTSATVRASPASTRLATSARSVRRPRATRTIR